MLGVVGRPRCGPATTGGCCDGLGRLDPPSPDWQLDPPADAWAEDCDDDLASEYWERGDRDYHEWIEFCLFVEQDLLAA